MQIATWNINGVKARLETALAWLKEAKPDVACLQEIKSVDEAFPKGPFEDLGYNVHTHGQKGFNGVAILSLRPLEDVSARLPGDDTDEQARYLEAVVTGDKSICRIGCLYLPNGNPVDSEKYPYKLAWMDRLIAHARTRLVLEEPFVLAGDYNIIPEARDAARPEEWLNDALFLQTSREKFRELAALGFTDALRSLDDSDGIYTFWDYQAGAWQRNNGIRIDHLMLSPQATDKLTCVRVDKHVRGWEKPSDHVPVVATLSV
ncbi:MAG: exodeoxyribonuclease III [Anderseniella sp.]|nr:exodeoxyribonuclease III [Anderseniella sp.]